MSLKVPFLAQERPDTCALACLRMILASLGTSLTEDQLHKASHLETGGVNPAELARLARQFGLDVEPQQLDLAGIQDLINQQQFPIAFIYRLPVDGVRSGHAVVVTGVSGRFVSFLDPLRGPRRLSRRKFAKAQRLMDHWVVA